MGVSGGYGAESGQLLTISCVNIIWTYFQFPRFLRDQEGGGGAGLPGPGPRLGTGGAPAVMALTANDRFGLPLRPACPVTPQRPDRTPQGQTDGHTHTHSLGPADLTPAGPTLPRGQHMSESPRLPPHVPVTSPALSVSAPQPPHGVRPPPHLCLSASEIVSVSLDFLAFTSLPSSPRVSAQSLFLLVGVILCPCLRLPILPLILFTSLSPSCPPFHRSSPNVPTLGKTQES